MPQLGPDGQPLPPGDGLDLTKGGWVIQMVGHHFHNSVPPDVQVGDEASQFVFNTFFKQLKEGTVELPDGEGGAPKRVKISDLGVKYPVIVLRKKVQQIDYPAEPEEAYQQRLAALSPQTPGGQPAPGADPKAMERKVFRLGRFDFVLQFMWQPQPRSVREEKEKQPAGPAAEGTDTAALGDGAATPGS
jgi:hypothetical protein